MLNFARAKQCAQKNSKNSSIKRVFTHKYGKTMETARVGKKGQQDICVQWIKAGTATNLHSTI